MTIYDFSVQNNRGETVNLSDFKGQVVLIVNTASKCGYTPQLGPLQALYKTYRDRGFAVIAFPSNQFAGQEPETDEKIASFYSGRYGVEFPIMAKGDVNGPEAIPLYQWLRESSANLKGQKTKRPGRPIKWNFTKFLINRQGEVVSRHEPSVQPMKLKAAIETLLQEPAS
jgi:glutathione peroxidase